MVRYYGACTEEDDKENVVRVMLVMEKVAGKSLERWRMNNNEPRNQEFANVMNIARQIAQAMHYVTASGVLHRDLTTANILVSA